MSENIGKAAEIIGIAYKKQWHGEEWGPYPAARALADAGLLPDTSELVATLKQARIDLSDWAQYAGDYFIQKHDLAGDLEGIDAVIRKYDPEWQR